MDIVFLVDATGSMAGEIDAVKRRLREILDALDSPTRVSVATFRDKNVDDPWYARNAGDLVDASSNGPKGFLGDARATGGGDIAESLYDGAVRTIEQLDWQSEARIVVAITDAPPLTDDRSDHTLDQVIDACAASRVVVVPILVGVN